MDLDLRQLEAFCRVVESGGFTAAATQLHLAQATVSERIGNLETEVGCRLLDRLGRRSVPTAVGRTLYRHAVDLLRRRERAVLEMQSLFGLQRGEVRIGASSVPGEDILPHFIGRFRDQYPEVVLNLRIADSQVVLEQVEAGDVEVGFVGSCSPSRRLEFVRLWQDQLVVVVPPTHPWAGREEIALDELAEEPFVRREAGSGTFRVLDERLEEGHAVPGFRLAAVIGSPSAVKHAVRSGVGVTVMSRRSVEAEVRAGTLAAVGLSGLRLERDIYLVRDTRRDLSSAGRAFVDFVQQQAGEP